MFRRFSIFTLALTMLLNMVSGAGFTHSCGTCDIGTFKDSVSFSRANEGLSCCLNGGSETAEALHSCCDANSHQVIGESLSAHSPSYIDHSTCACPVALHANALTGSKIVIDDQAPSMRTLEVWEGANWYDSPRLLKVAESHVGNGRFVLLHHCRIQV